MLVLVEKMAEGYRASSGKPLEAETEGATPDEAVQRLRDLVEHRLQGSVAIIEMKIPGETAQLSSPWLRLHGSLRDDPTFDEWQEAIAAARRAEDEAGGIYPDRNP